MCEHSEVNGHGGGCHSGVVVTTQLAAAIGDISTRGGVRCTTTRPALVGRNGQHRGRTAFSPLISWPLSTLASVWDGQETSLRRSQSPRRTQTASNEPRYFSGAGSCEASEGGHKRCGTV